MYMCSKHTSAFLYTLFSQVKSEMARYNKETLAAAAYMLFYDEDDNDSINEKRARRWWIAPQCKSRDQEGELYSVTL